MDKPPNTDAEALKGGRSGRADEDRNGVRSADLLELRVGTRLKHARLTIGARLRDIAEKAGCSESLVSKIENDRVMPSLKLLHRLCAALNMTLGEIMSTPDPDEKKVWRQDERPVIELDPTRPGVGVRLERLVPYARGHLLQGSIHIIAPGGGSRGFITHEGEEVGYVLAGEIELVIGDETHRLRSGDSFIFRSEVPHGYRNPGSDEARVIFVNTPPSF